MKTLIELSIAFLLLGVSPAAAYVGPGLGLGALGAVAGVLLSVVLAVVAIVWYPMKRVFKRRRENDGKTGGHR